MKSRALDHMVEDNGRILLVKFSWTTAKFNSIHTIKSYIDVMLSESTVSGVTCDINIL